MASLSLDVANDPKNVPVFGRYDNGVKYTDRPGAYGFLLDSQARLAIVQTTFGFFLPGGGAEPGESLDAALKREILEELGLQVISARVMTQAIQYHWSGFYKQHFKKIGTFFLVEVVPLDPHPGCQAEHSLVWWSPHDAHLKLSQEFQRWAVAAVFLKP